MDWRRRPSSLIRTVVDFLLSEHRSLVVALVALVAQNIGEFIFLTRHHRYYRDGGGYYIDVGCSQLIVDGKVKIKQGQEIESLTRDGVLFADGIELKADIVVCATGYSSMKDTVRRVVSDDVASRLNTVWGKDQQGEIPSVWRNSGVKGTSSLAHSSSLPSPPFLLPCFSRAFPFLKF